MNSADKNRGDTELINDWLEKENFTPLNKDWIKLGDGGGEPWERDSKKTRKENITF